MKLKNLLITAFLTLIIGVASARSEAEADKKVAETMAQLSLDEKLGLLHGFGAGKSEYGDKNSKSFGVSALERLSIPEMLMGHGITGTRVGRSKSVNATYFCAPVGIGCSWDTELYKRVGLAMAREMRGLGQDLNLGPTLNIVRHPLGGRSWESYSEDPYLSARMIVPYAQSMQSEGIICGPKHFAANNQERNRFDINNEIDERTLREIYLPAFEAAVKEGGVLNMMGAYNQVNGVNMCHNSYILTDILRKEWGFKGFVLSDFSNGVKSTLEAANAGLNIEMDGMKFYGPKMKIEIENGNLSMDVVDNLVREYLRVLYLFDIDTRERNADNKIHTPEAIALAKEVALASQVLLKNDGILPLDANKKQSIAVIGPNAKYPTEGGAMKQKWYYLQGGGSGRCYYFDGAVVEPFVGISGVVGSDVTLSYAQGSIGSHAAAGKKNAEQTAQMLKTAVDVAKSSDKVILVVGLSGANESEGRDKTSVNLPAVQETLIKKVSEVNKNVVVCVVAGGYVDMSAWEDKVSAIVYVPYCGEQVGNGLADILFGNASPSGKLATTWPKSVKDFPKGSIFTGEGFSKAGVANVYSEGIFVGYRYFDTKKIEPAYPFGYGLSYTTFKYSNLKAKKKGKGYVVTVDVKNTGNYDAKEIAQLYVSDLKSSVERPEKELKGFTKIDLKKGETKTVTFTLDDRSFAYYDVTKKSWIVEPGDFEILVGGSSRGITEEVKISVK